MSKFTDLYDKLLSDEKFRRFLAENPSDALKSIGIDPTPRVLDAVKEVMKGVAEMESLLGGGTHHPDVAV